MNSSPPQQPLYTTDRAVEEMVEKDIDVTYPLEDMQPMPEVKELQTAVMPVKV